MKNAVRTADQLYRIRRDHILANIGIYEELILENIEYARLFTLKTMNIYKLQRQMYDDIYAQICLSFCKNARKYDPNRNASFHTYMEKIVENDINEYINKTWDYEDNSYTVLINNNDSEGMTGEETDILETASYSIWLNDNTKRRISMDQLLLFLPPDEQEIISALFIEKTTIKDLATKTGKSSSYIVSKREDALIKLKDKIIELQAIFK